ncbi:hypothetical protein [Mycolicibacterium sp. YH-1]|uniref:hypothetical protein n=1 Tax=Mycolicibacterium sp. YH-1 TaxID=2908837 RepID=UPI001F4C265B|nr:hypothetical protein [Mycolicibacterium sp. YH-1]UNB52912.1 hypothetical protein L0M16_00540 [Mycolicibacterium sp. YH-1]
MFIEFTLHSDFGRDTLCWPTVNRLVLRDGKAIERVTYFDPLAVLPTLLRHPSVWWQWLHPLKAARPPVTRNATERRKPCKTI